MATRANKILSRVRNRISVDLQPTISNQQIYSVASEIERLLAEEFLCIENSTTISVTTGNATYSVPTGVFRVKMLVPPTTSRIRYVERDINDFDWYERYGRYFVSPAAYTQYYKIWNGQIKFFPTPTADVTLALYYYGVPTTAISETVEPEVPSVFDEAIIYGTLEEIYAQYDDAKNEKYEMKYQVMKQDAMSKWRSRHAVTNTIEYNDLG